jgi:anti-sigma factor ChrR (cupin superfamily)
MRIVMDSDMKDDFCEQAALYALGVLDGDELILFERHLEQGCGICETELNKSQYVIDQLSHIPPTVSPPSSIRSTLLQRIKNVPLHNRENQPLETKIERPNEGLTFIKAADNRWQEILPGIKLKPLFVDKKQRRMTALARMEPNTAYAAHRHTAPEEFYILEGSCFCGGQLLYPGDYHRAETGSIHTETSTTEGCLMFIIFSPENEMLGHV